MAIAYPVQNASLQGTLKEEEGQRFLQKIKRKTCPQAHVS
jgi:hypothetical protein